MFGKDKEVELGDVVKDKITGFEGVVVAITEWLHACKRVTVQPKAINKDGKPVENDTFDSPQLEMVKKGEYTKPEKKESEKTGGPSIAPTRACDPI